MDLEVLHALFLSCGIDGVNHMLGDNNKNSSISRVTYLLSMQTYMHLKLKIQNAETNLSSDPGLPGRPFLFLLWTTEVV